jgi:hypothetical protein
MVANLFVGAGCAALVAAAGMLHPAAGLAVFGALAIYAGIGVIRNAG